MSYKEKKDRDKKDRKKKDKKYKKDWEKKEKKKYRDDDRGYKKKDSWDDKRLKRGLILKLESVEIARGHDGTLRGRPEPTFIFAAFGVKDDNISLLDRALRRIVAKGPYPKTIETRDKDDRNVFRVSVPEAWTRVLVLGLAVEKDKGKDIEELYATLAEPSLLSGFRIRDMLPDPLTLAEAGLGPLSTPPGATLVHLMRDGVTLDQLCQSDDYVGCSLVVLEPGLNQTENFRFHFASEDGKNDWTALVGIQS